jgi:large subunit ribosomal protein L47
LNWPRIQPLTEEEVEDLRIKPLEDIITHNWSNTLDYTEREALLTGRSLWELPITIDASCGDADKVPPNWERPDKGILDQTPFLWDEY